MKKKEGKDFLPIGTWVMFNKRVEAVQRSHGRNRDFVEVFMAAYDAHVGQIVGATYLRRGYTDGGGYDESLYFVSKGKPLFVYLVRVGFLNKPLWILPERVDEIEPREMPYMFQAIHPLTRDQMSRDMKAINREGLLPRDEKGRFVPVG